MSQRRILPILCVVVGMMGAGCRAGSAAPTASMTPRAEAASTDSTPADVQRPPVTPTVSLAEAQPTVDAISLPAAFTGPLPPGANARLGTGIIPVYPAARNQWLASPDTGYVAIPSGAGMHFYRADTGEEEWVDTLEQLVFSMVWSPDGSMLAAGSRFGEIVVWDVPAHKRLHTLYAHHGVTIDTLTWSPDGSILASGGSDARVILWNPSAGAALHVLEGDWDGSADILVFSPDSAKILAGYHFSHTDAPKASQAPTVWDTRNGDLLYTLDYFRASYWSSTSPSNQWSADGKLLVADETIYDAATGKVVGTLDDLQGVAWSPSEPLLAVAGAQVGVWDTQSGRLAWSQEGDGLSVQLLWSPDGARLLEVTDVGLRLWDAHVGQLLWTNTYRTNAQRIEWSPEETLLVVETNEPGYQIVTFDARTGEVVSEIPGCLADISWAPNSAVLVIGTATWGTDSITLTDARTGKVMSRLDGTDYVLGLAWSPDGKYLAATSTDDYQSHQATLWDIQQRNVLRTVSLPSRSDRLSWSSDGRLLAASWPGSTTIMDRTGFPLTTDPALKESPFVFSPQGDLFLAGRTIRDTASGLESSTLSSSVMPLRDIAWVPDGTMLATAESMGDVWSASSELTVWEASTGKVLRILQGHSLNVNSIAWSPDGTKLVSGASGFLNFEEADGGAYVHWGNEVIIWDAASGEALLTLKDESLELTDVAWSPDGALLAVSYGAAPEWLFGNGYDVYLNRGKVVLLDAQTGGRIKELEGHSTSVQTITFSPDGSLLASGSLDGTVIVWDVH
jgi:WD40 repeat protein